MSLNEANSYIYTIWDWLYIYIAYQFIVRHNWNDIIIKMLNCSKSSVHFLLQKSPVFFFKVFMV